MKSKMDSIHTNRVWTLVDPSEGIKLIKCKWVFKRKIDMKVNIQMHKAKLIVKGYRQRQVIDFDETFLLVAMLKFTRIFLGIALYHDYKIWQIDIKVIFLNRNTHKICIWHNLKVWI